jgi:hypothetical protein
MKFLRWLPYTAFYALIRYLIKSPNAASDRQRPKP